ncbi:hypothetical protein BDZ97DRAFT_1920989 [Flammula alnicola]|nr:hypothetical protein BDZ97DRAFT_1920989 [Flammula alnicola]
MASDEESSGGCTSSDEATDIRRCSVIGPGLRLIPTPGSSTAPTLLQNRELTDPTPSSTITIPNPLSMPTIPAAVPPPTSQSAMAVSFMEAFDHMWIGQPGDQGHSTRGRMIGLDSVIIKYASTDSTDFTLILTYRKMRFFLMWPRRKSPQEVHADFEEASWHAFFGALHQNTGQRFKELNLGYDMTSSTYPMARYMVNSYPYTLPLMSDIPAHIYPDLLKLNLTKVNIAYAAFWSLSPAHMQGFIKGLHSEDPETSTPPLPFL